LVSRQSIVVLAAMLAVAAVPRQANAQSDGMTVTVTGRANGGEVVVPAGGTLVVRLASNRTTGYSWQVQKMNERLLKQQGKPVYEEPRGARPGEGGHEVFAFKAANSPASDTSLALQYSRPFERNLPPARTFRIDIHLGRGPGVRVTEKDNGRNVTVAPGANLIVRLPSSASTGYSWSVDPNTSRLLKLQGKPRYQSPEDAAPGTPGHQVFRFLVAEQPGADADLTLRYNPPGSNRRPQEKFSVTVRIRRNAP
jgi:inhibitor of cysteine peptidase